MILNESEVTERMSSPLNLLNRLKDLTNRHSAAVRNSSNPFGIVSIPSAKEVIPDLDEKLANQSNTIKSKASGIMIQAMDELKLRVEEAKTPAELAKIAAEMNKIVTAETESNRGNENRPQFVLYAPQFNNENHYETIYARE